MIKIKLQSKKNIKRYIKWKMTITFPHLLWIIEEKKEGKTGKITKVLYGLVQNPNHIEILNIHVAILAVNITTIAVKPNFDFLP